MTPTNDKTRQVELLISNLLRIGVVASLCVIVCGTVLTFVHDPDYMSSRQAMPRLTEPGATFPHTLHDVVEGLKSLRGQALIVAGLLLLIATPVMRVAVSIFAFVFEKDPAFVLITSIVLLLLLLSFALGAVG